jgi:hypothetical protein
LTVRPLLIIYPVSKHKRTFKRCRGCSWFASLRRFPRPVPGKMVCMTSMKVLDQLDTLIDDLLNESDLRASSLASMLTAARDSVNEGYHVALARRVWEASNAIKDHYVVAVVTPDSGLDLSRIK